jgi:L-fucose isomerase-like protein
MGKQASDPLHTFGGAGVVEIPKMQELLRYICENGFEHHVAPSFSTTAAPVNEAASKYPGWKMHWPQ